MKKTMVLCILLSAFYIKTYTQTGYFNNIFHINNLWTGGKSIIYKDSVFYFAALSHDTIYNIYAVKRISLCKSDYNGNLIYRKSLGWDSRNYYLGHSGCFQETYDNGFFAVGIIEDTNNNKAFLMKVNSNYDTVFFREYSDTIYNSLEFRQGKETNDRGFIMVGTKPGSGSYNKDVFILKTDSLGNEEWRKTINLGNWDFAQNVIQTPDKGYLLGCYHINVNDNNSGDGRILKLDSLGNFEWGQIIGGPKQDGVPIVALAKDSNYIVATSYAYITVFGAASDLKIQIVKLDKADGSIIWNKQYDTIRTINYPSTLKVLENGDIITVGNTDIWDGYNYYGTCWLLKINENGDSLLYRQFYKNNDNYTQSNYVYDFCITEDKSIVTCGYFQTDTAYSYLWLAKMDSLGCLQPGCQYVGVEELQNAKEGELKVFPNPATTQTTITYPTAEKVIMLQIYNMHGQMIYEEKLSKGSSQTIINTSGFNSGLYKVVAGESSGSLIIN